MSKHTTGPWHVTNHGAIEAKDRQIASVQSGGLIDMDNARLIAAAPDLLSVAYAVDDMADRIDHDPDSRFGELIANARAAIAKATGES